jgi:hypothetical protein
MAANVGPSAGDASAHNPGLFERLLVDRQPLNGGAALVILAASILYFADYFILGENAHIRLHELFDSEYARIVWVARNLAKFGYYQWQSDFSGGLPIWISPMPLSYPQIYMALLWSPRVVYLLTIVLCGFCAGYGFYRLSTSLLRISAPIALAGGILYLVAVHAHASVTTALAHLYLMPMVLVLLHDPLSCWGNRWIRSGAIFVLTAFTIAIFNAKMFMPFHALLLAWLWVDGRRADRRDVVAAAALWAGLLLAYAPTFFGLIEFMPLQSRDFSAAATASTTLPALAGEMLRRMMLMMATDVGSMAPLSLIWAAMALLPKSRRVRWAASGYTLAAAMSAVAYTPHLLSALGLTALVKMDLGHLNMMLMLFGTLLGCLAMDELRHQPTRVRGLALALATTGTAVAVANAGSPALAAFSVAPAVLALATLKLSQPLAFVFGRNDRLTAGIAAWVAAVILTVAASKAVRLQEDTVPYARVFGANPVLARLGEEAARSPFRVGVMRLIPEYSTKYAMNAVVNRFGLESLDGRSALFNIQFKRYMRLINRPAFARFGLEARWWSYFYSVALADNMVVPGNARLSGDLWVMPLLAAANVRYLVSGQPIGGMTAVDMGPQAPGDAAAPVYVYAVPGAMPRARLVRRLEPAADDDAAMQRLAGADLNWLRDNAVVQADGAGDLPAGEGECGSASLEQLSPDHLRIAVEARAACHLVVANNHQPGWSAAVDGVETPVLRANLAFQAVPIGAAGSHVVDLHFDRPWFRYTLPVPVVGFLLAAAAVFLGRRRIE